MNVRDMTAQEIYDFLVGDFSSSGVDFFTFAADEIEKMRKDNRHGSAANYQSTITAIKSFYKLTTLTFDQINIVFLNKFEVFLKERMVRGKQIGDRGIELHMNAIKALFNRAMIKYNTMQVQNIKYSPFSTYKVNKSKPPNRDIALSVDQLKLIVLYKPKSSREELAKDCFLIRFYLCGINTVDLYSLNKPANERVIYQRSKTKGRRVDKAEISIRLEPEIISYLDKYTDSERCFNFYERYSNCRNFNKAINIGLKTIGRSIGVDNLQYYAARHSWATIAFNNGVSSDYIAQALNHVSAHSITHIYIGKDYSNIDKANRVVLDLIK